MKGRFLSYSFLTSLIVLVLWLASKKSKWLIGTALVFISSYTVLFSHTPVNSSLEYINRDNSFGVSDERGFYFNSVSLYKYLRSDPETFPFPIHPMTQLGRNFKQSDIDVTVESVIGIFGFHAGTEKIIIDPLGLADPFLARLPAKEGWRIGHFDRNFPQGYFESVKSGENMIEDPELREYYNHLKLVVQSPDLFSPKRLRTILNFNLGRYDYLLP